MWCNDRSKEFLWSANKNDLKAYDNRKTSVGQENDYRSRCLLDYRYFKKKKKELIALDLSKEQKLDADTKAIQQIILTGNLNKGKGARMYFSIEEAKETVPDLSKWTVKVLWFYLVLIKY